MFKLKNIFIIKYYILFFIYVFTVAGRDYNAVRNEYYENKLIKNKLDGIIATCNNNFTIYTSELNNLEFKSIYSSLQKNKDEFNNSEFENEYFLLDDIKSNLKSLFSWTLLLDFKNDLAKKKLISDLQQQIIDLLIILANKISK